MESLQFDIHSLPLSSSVQNAVNSLPPGDPVDAWVIIAAILKIHPEYGGGIAGKLRYGGKPREMRSQPVSEWFRELAGLFDMDRLGREGKKLNGRLTIWGLAQLSDEIRKYLDSSGFLEILEQEYEKEEGIRPETWLRGFTPEAEKSDSRAGMTDRELLFELKKVQSIRDLAARVAAYLELMPRLPEQGRQETADRVLKEILGISDPSARVNAYISLLPHIPGDQQKNIALQALEDTKAIKDPALSERAARQLAQYLPEEEAKRYSPPVAGYISDRADQELPDLLDIEHEVANIAHVLTFKQVEPPLALGLFGDWGSGKTFFMGKLRKNISQIAGHYRKQEQATGQEAQWCSRVAQIEFNAWHFSDSNLWASLVTRIYEGLDHELNQEKEMAQHIKKKILEASIEEARERTVAAESRLDTAQAQVGSAQETLKEKTKEREERENRLRSLIGNIPNLLGEREAAALKGAAKALGIPEAAQTYEALEELDGQLGTLSGRLTAVTTSLLRSPWTLVIMAGIVLVLPVLVTSAIERYGQWLTETGKRVAEISTFLLAVIGWLQAQVRHGLGLVDRVGSALQKARGVRQQKIENDPGVIAASKALVEAETEEQAARTNLEMAQTELQRLQEELQELRPERRLQRLIEERASSGAYARHLGIISLIRSDFENMSHILAEMLEERIDLKKEKTPREENVGKTTETPIQRIILYIDDLDRCTPDRVVEVLEAIYLLLYFKLFVVVVAVDPRWLRHSLAKHYPATLAERGGLVSLDGRGELSPYSTPQDYLEKIFQIPFALRPVEKDGYQNLVNDLLKPLPERRKRLEVAPVERGGAAIVDREKPVSGGGTPMIAPFETVSEHEPEKPYSPIPPRQLSFTDWEKADIERLWRLFRTPRTVKRFINIYRLLRAGLLTDEEVQRFEGTKHDPGEYQVALLLLAALTAFPNLSSRFLARLDAWMDGQETARRAAGCTWKEVIGDLRKADTPVPDAQATSALQARSQSSEAGQVGDEEATAETWKILLDSLEKVTQDDAWMKSFPLRTMRVWAMRAARFSFSVQPT